MQKVFSGNSSDGFLCRVTVPNGTHLAEFKSGVGNLGTVLDGNNQIAGQAVLNPLACNPTMLFMDAAMAGIDKKLDAIQDLQQEMMGYLKQKEDAEIRGNLIFLNDILNNYRYNTENDLYKNNNHIKVLDIRQAAEQKIQLFRSKVSSELQRKSFLHVDRDVRTQVDKIQEDLKEYELALYMHAFSSFLDIMLVGNYTPEYLNGIRTKIEDYALQYRELYTESYSQLESKLILRFSLLCEKGWEVQVSF